MKLPLFTRLSRPQTAWRRADGQRCTREHLLMALADISVFMIRATYMDNMAESRCGGEGATRALMPPGFV